MLRTSGRFPLEKVEKSSNKSLKRETPDSTFGRKRKPFLQVCKTHGLSTPETTEHDNYDVVACAHNRLDARQNCFFSLYAIVKQ